MKSLTAWNLCILTWLVTCIPLAGCAMPGEKKLVDVKAEYLGLANQKVAVMSAADAHLLHLYPQAPTLVSQAVSKRIARHVPGVTLIIPKELAAFLKANPYWANLPYSQLVDKLGVDKVVLIDLIEYQTHEPGNAYVWQGLITANIGVIDAHAADPDNLVYQNTVSVRFPEKSSVGIVDADHESIQLGMLYLFGKKAGGLFYDHQIEVDK